MILNSNYFIQFLSHASLINCEIALSLSLSLSRVTQTTGFENGIKWSQIHRESAEAPKISKAPLTSFAKLLIRGLPPLSAINASLNNGCKPSARAADVAWDLSMKYVDSLIPDQAQIMRIDLR